MHPHRLAASLLAATLLVPCLASARDSASKAVSSQLDFGVKMARQGLWSEALFRFQEAAKLEPENPRVLSNIGVAFEATGKFDLALDAYQRALKVAPSDKDIRNNYARFVEFYQGYKGEKKTKDIPAAFKSVTPSKAPPLPTPTAPRDPAAPSDMPPSPSSPPEDIPPPTADVPGSF
jgi:Tfp pilus assembly protein PilF